MCVVYLHTYLLKINFSIHFVENIILDFFFFLLCRDTHLYYAFQTLQGPNIFSLYEIYIIIKYHKLTDNLVFEILHNELFNAQLIYRSSELIQFLFSFSFIPFFGGRCFKKNIINYKLLF